jgi:hypothetical protein
MTSPVRFLSWGGHFFRRVTRSECTRKYEINVLENVLNPLIFSQQSKTGFILLNGMFSLYSASMGSMGSRPCQQSTSLPIPLHEQHQHFKQQREEWIRRFLNDRQKTTNS